jgi:hypothetical protein
MTMGFIKKHWLVLVVALVAVWYYRRSSTSSIGVSGANPYGVPKTITDAFTTMMANGAGSYGITADMLQPADQTLYPGYYVATAPGGGAPAYFKPDLVHPLYSDYFSPGSSPVNYNLSAEQQAANEAFGEGAGQAVLDTEQSAIENYDPNAPKSQKIVY